MIRSDTKITSQAIEFWCTVCNIEIELNEKNVRKTLLLSREKMN